MPFVKVVKNRAYFKRFQVKFRRRREGKTDYQARRKLVCQDKNKYNSPKYRFVVRITNTRIICQIIYATFEGDRVVCSAESNELKRYGIPVGLSNYAAAYCTGLLCARRLLKNLNMDEMYVGLPTASGEDYNVTENISEDRRPFKALLDVGLVRTTTGCRVFGAMKGAVDGGLHIPHNHKRFPGYNKEEDSYDASVHRSRILGHHIANYMRLLEEENSEEFKAHFRQFIEAGITADSIEQMYLKAHELIRANPERPEKEFKNIKSKREGNYIITGSRRILRPKKLTVQQRKERVMRKLKMLEDIIQSQEE